MEKVMTIEEIEQTFDSEWVLIADPETDEQLNVLSGKVIHHNKDRVAFDREVLRIPNHPKDFAVIYTGTQPEGMEYVL
ncbi:MAG: hypothetical protein AB7P14_26145 [Blastocatellales bacterium]